MAAHRYWRLKWDSSNRGYCSCASLELHAVVGGPDITGNAGGAPIGGDSYGGNTGDYGWQQAFDHNPATAWSSSGGQSWIGWDFGAGNAYDIAEIAYTPRAGDPNADPTAGGIEWSDDGAAWTRSNPIVPPDNYPDNSPVIFSNAAPPPLVGGHRYWRIRGLTLNAGLMTASGVQMRIEVGGASVIGRGLAIASSVYDPNSYPIAAAYHSVTSPSFWASAGGQPGAEWIGYDFSDGNAPDIVEITYGRNANDGNRAPSQAAIEWSDNGEDWTQAWVADFGSFDPQQVKTFDKPPPSGSQAVEASGARLFSIVKNTAKDEQLSAARVFAIYRFFTEAAQISAARTIVAVKRNSHLDVSQARVNAVVAGRVADPQVRAWTYTLDGHDFYVLRLGDAQTLVYDVATQQWTEWETPGSGAWKPNTGFSWIGAQALAHTYGSDVVAGDDTFGLLYFLDPTLPWDESPYANGKQLPFDRIVTAQTLVNGRQYIPCFAVFAGGDNYGLVAQDFTPQITLDTSDDQGRTFYSHETLDVEMDPDVDGNYAWYSLGQIQSPGRIFRITDNGVFTRIDSVEMNDDGN